MIFYLGEDLDFLKHLSGLFGPRFVKLISHFQLDQILSSISSTTHNFAIVDYKTYENALVKLINFNSNSNLDLKIILVCDILGDHSDLSNTAGVIAVHPSKNKEKIGETIKNFTQ